METSGGKLTMGAEGYIWIRGRIYLDNEIQKESGRCSAGCTGRNIRIREIFRRG